MKAKMKYQIDSVLRGCRECEDNGRHEREGRAVQSPPSMAAKTTPAPKKKSDEDEDLMPSTTPAAELNASGPASLAANAQISSLPRQVLQTNLQRRHLPRPPHSTNNHALRPRHPRPRSAQTTLSNHERIHRRRNVLCSPCATIDRIKRDYP